MVYEMALLSPVQGILIGIRVDRRAASRWTVSTVPGRNPQ